jgi:hypothetical protein
VLAPVGAYIQLLDEAPEWRDTFIHRAGGHRSGLADRADRHCVALRGKGNITLHRQWMVRSYAVALVFFEGRFISGVTGLESNPAMVEPIIWACLALSVLLVMS